MPKPPNPWGRWGIPAMVYITARSAEEALTTAEQLIATRDDTDGQEYFALDDDNDTAVYLMPDMAATLRTADAYPPPYDPTEYSTQFIGAGSEDGLGIEKP